jgi:hypothetical protein
MEDSMQNAVRKFEELLAAVKDGGGENDENWDYFGEHIRPLLKEESVFNQAFDMLQRGEPNEHYRHAGATVLACSVFTLRSSQQGVLAEKMRAETNPFAKHWMANALYKNGNRTPEVVEVWKEASVQDTPAGDFARGLRGPL